MPMRKISILAGMEQTTRLTFLQKVVPNHKFSVSRKRYSIPPPISVPSPEEPIGRLEDFKVPLPPPEPPHRAADSVKVPLPQVESSEPGTSDNARVHNIPTRKSADDLNEGMFKKEKEINEPAYRFLTCATAWYLIFAAPATVKDKLKNYSVI